MAGSVFAQDDPRFIEFVRLFNEEKFFEAHEVLEGLWLESKGPAKHAYQGLIQVAAALYQLQRGNRKGCKALLSKAQGHFEQAGGTKTPMDARRLLRLAGACLETGAPCPKIKAP